MLRNALLSALAAAALAGCATGYSYRDGDGGDYYYSQPRVEYRYLDPYGTFGGIGYGLGGYYYDGFGRLILAGPYGYYGYGFPYGHGRGWYRPRPPQHPDHDGQGNGQAGDRGTHLPPWRSPGGMTPRPRRTADEDGDEMRSRRQSRPFTMPEPPQRERRMHSDDAGGSRMGGVIRGAKSLPSMADE